MIPAAIATVSEPDYLRGERTSEERHEYVAGQVFAMTGASLAHNMITGNIYASLRAQLVGGPCRAHFTDVKVRIEQGPTYYYPDVAVTCDERDTAVTARHYIEHPSVVFEVLSPSTETTDRREKLAAYRLLPALRHYVLVAQDPRRVEHYVLSREGWLHEILDDGTDVLDLKAVGAQVRMAAVYEGV